MCRRGWGDCKGEGEVGEWSRWRCGDCHVVVVAASLLREQGESKAQGKGTGWVRAGGRVDILWWNHGKDRGGVCTYTSGEVVR